MRAAFLLAVFAFAPALASAQQPCTPDAESAVDAVYRQVLERPAGGEGNARAEQLRRGETTGREIVREVAKSPEHRQRFLIANSQEGRVNAIGNLYRHLLARQPDPAGLDSHVQALANTDVSQIIDIMIDSGGATEAETFDSLDINRSGTLTPNEWKWTTRSFDRYDTDGDGLLTRREFNVGGGAPQ